MHGQQGKHSTCTNKTDCQKGPAFSDSQSVRIRVSYGQLAISVRIGLVESCLKSAKTLHTHRWSTCFKKKAPHACYSQTPHLLASNKKGRNKELGKKMTESDHHACACKLPINIHSHSKRGVCNLSTLSISFVSCWRDCILKQLEIWLLDLEFGTQKILKLQLP